MKTLILIAGLLMVATPAGAQTGTSTNASANINGTLANGTLSAAQGFSGSTSIQQGLGSPSGTSQPTTGVICEEEMTATFCNVITRPNNNGYGGASGSASGGGAGSSSSASGGGAGSSGGVSTSTPVCPDFPPANELCY